MVILLLTSCVLWYLHGVSLCGLQAAVEVVVGLMEIVAEEEAAVEVGLEVLRNTQISQGIHM